MRYLVVGLSLALAGCAVAWGSSYNVESESPQAVTISYDPALTTSRDIVAVANQSCAHYQKVAIAKSQTLSVLAIAQIEFACADASVVASQHPIPLRDMVYVGGAAQAPTPSYLPNPAL